MIPAVSINIIDILSQSSNLGIIITFGMIAQAPVIYAIHWINLYPVDSAVRFVKRLISAIGKNSVGKSTKDVTEFGGTLFKRCEVFSY